MKKVKIEIDLFELKELGNEAMERAIEEHRNFLLNTVDDDADYEGRYSDILEDDEYVIDNIELNEYLFYSHGDLAHTINYCGNHPKTGTRELILGSKVYQL